MEKLQSVQQFQELIKEGKHIFLFSADWCPDCHFIEPFIEEVVAAYPEYSFTYVDRDEHLELCQLLEVMGIPSFIAFENGKQSGRFVSGARKTRDQIEAFIQQLSK